MRIVFMGTPEFAIPSLNILLENRYEIASVVTGPDRPAGRGQKVSQSPVKAFSAARGLQVLQPEKLKDPVFLEELAALGPQLFVVVAYRILPPEVLRIPAFGGFNLHASLLPRYRGAAPIQWAIIRGERETGVTTFFLKEQVDTGGIILQARTTIAPEDTAGDLHDRLAAIGAELVLQTVRLIETGKAVPKRQDDALATTAPKLRKEDCKIDWSRSAGEVHNFIRGLSPKPCAYSFYGGKTLKMHRSKLTGEERGGSPGEILRADSRLVVAAGSGSLSVEQLQLEGKNILPAEKFLRGFALRVGDRFS